MASATPSLATRNPWEPTTRKRERTRRALIVAAERVFTTAGVERARVDDIAGLAGYSVGAIYTHFGNKDGLTVAYLDAVASLLDEDLAALRTDPSPISRVLAAGDAYVRHVIDYPVASRIATARAATSSAELRTEAAAALDRKRVASLMTVAKDLKASMDAGEIPAAPVDRAMLFVWSTWHGMATMVARCDRLAVPPDAAWAALAHGRTILAAGLGLRGGLGPAPAGPPSS